MAIRGYGLSHPGRVRDHNEDAFVVDDALGVYIVADGLGGHAGGETAARLATDSVLQTLAGIGSTAIVSGDLDAIERVVSRAAVNASRTVFERARAQASLREMGCTLTMLVVAGRSAVLAHIGDSRLYRVRRGRIEQLTRDHTLAAERVANGEMNAAEARDLPYANILTRCVGMHASAHADIKRLRLEPGDRLVLCSDGLSTYFEDLAELAQLVSALEPGRAPRELVRIANERGGRDNVTCVLIAIPDCRGDCDAFEYSRAAVVPR